MKKINFKNKWLIALVALFGVSLISSGVFAAATITINGNNQVNLGAGAAAVNVCDSSATISTDQTFNSNLQRFELTTINLTGVDKSLCEGKTITLAFVAGGVTKSASWAISGSSPDTLVYAVSPAIDTANSSISTIAISAQ